jgi:peptidoglycan/LPS O-acetylase OafA/YrhL
VTTGTLGPPGGGAPVIDGAGSRTLGRVRSLDGIRGLAITLVVLFHLAGLFSATGGVVRGGYIGVDVFFVLSGFLITSLLLSERVKRGSISFRRFYLRRAFRLLPALAAFLTAHVIYTLVVHDPRKVEAKAVLSIAVYVGNWAQALGMAVPIGLRQTWSLAVEEQFYLIWPITLILIVHFFRSRRAILAVLGLGIVASALYRGLDVAFWHGYPGAYVRTDTRADNLLVGSALAFLWHWGWVPRKWAMQAAAWAGLAALLWTTVFLGKFSVLPYYGGFTVVGIGVAAMILAAADGRWLGVRLFEMAPLRALGKVSYGLYLWQAGVLEAVHRAMLHRPALAQAAVALLVTAAFTMGSWVFIERPFLGLKERWTSTDGRPPGPSSPAEARVALP